MAVDALTTSIPQLDALLGGGLPVGHLTTIRVDVAGRTALTWAFIQQWMNATVEHPWEEYVLAALAERPPVLMLHGWGRDLVAYKIAAKLASSRTACVLFHEGDLPKEVKFYAWLRLHVDTLSEGYRIRVVKNANAATQGHSCEWDGRVFGVLPEP
jgi:hypothetical protein